MTHSSASPRAARARASRLALDVACALLSCVGFVTGSAVAAAPPPARGDVVVYGATPAGIMAAVAASERARHVVLLEPSRQIGGMVTSGISVTDYWGSRYISGPTLAVFRGIGNRYGQRDPEWNHEPKIAESVLQALLRRHPSIQLVTGAQLRAVRMQGRRIAALTTSTGDYPGAVFVDASYEGDVMAGAGVPFVVGREAASRYREPDAGIRIDKPLCEYCTQPVSAVDAHGRPLPFVEAGGDERAGDGDDRAMNDNFRLCLTDDPANRAPIPEPAHYDPARFALFSRIAAALPHAEVKTIEKGGGHYVESTQVRSAYFNMTELPKRKYDLNSGSVFLLEYPDGASRWALADAAERARIYADHREYTLEFFKWMKTDPAVPAAIKTAIAPFGLCADEWTANGHWPPLLYVREGRRMVADDVVTENDILRKRRYGDAVLAAFAPFDAKSTRLVLHGPAHEAYKDGNLYKSLPPFAIPYRAIVPGAKSVANLVVPVALSSSHVAYAAIRMEPILMGLGTAAGEAAALAVERDTAVQAIDPRELRSRLAADGQTLSP